MTWIAASLIFWIFLACLETGRALIIGILPPPLGRSVLPSLLDIELVVASFSLYALFSVPFALALALAEKVFRRLTRKVRSPLPDLSRMDLFLLAVWGLAGFKWISTILPYVTHADHLPRTPYLAIVPLLVSCLFLKGYFRERPRYYMMQWGSITLGVFILSKTGYDLFIASPSAIWVKALLLALVAAAAVVSALLLQGLLNRVLRTEYKPGRLSAALCLVLLLGGMVFTVRALQTRNSHPAFSTPAVDSPKKVAPLMRNAVVVVVDCLRTDHLGCYGYAENTSPFIDSLAQSGTLYENCIAPSSWTIPSVASFFTGVYPQQHGMNRLGSVIPEDLVTMHEIMKDQGVQTAAFITNDYLRPRFGYAKGFSHYFEHYLNPEFQEQLASRLFFFNALLHFKNEYGYPPAVDPGGARWWSVGLPPFNHGRIAAERVTDDVLSWLEMHGREPFYLYLHFMDVHSPYDTTWYPLFEEGRYAVQDVRDKLINTYDGRVAYVDKQISRIWGALVTLRKADATLLVVTADHGEELYDHQGVGHCTTLYEELINVPLVLANPLLTAEGRRVETQVELIDLAPTVLDFLGLPVPEQMSGRSLLHLPGDGSDLTGPAFALSYTTRGRKSLKTAEGQALWKQKVWDQGIILESLRVDNRWKLILGNDGQTELYDLKEDAAEQNDLKGSEAARVSELSKKLAEQSSSLRKYLPRQEQVDLSPDARNKLKALGYL